PLGEHVASYALCAGHVHGGTPPRGRSSYSRTFPEPLFSHAHGRNDRMRRGNLPLRTDIQSSGTLAVRNPSLGSWSMGRMAALAGLATGSLGSSSDTSMVSQRMGGGNQTAERW